MENNNEKGMCQGCSKSCGGCGSSCSSINHHSVIRILVGIIVLMVVFFAGFKTGLFFGQVMDGGYSSRGGYSKMMFNRDFDGSGSRQRMMDGSGFYKKQSAPASTSTTQ